MEPREPEVGDVVLYHVRKNDDETLRSNNTPVLPAVVVRVWGADCVNLKVFCDGPQDAWVTSVTHGSIEGHWQYPVK